MSDGQVRLLSFYFLLLYLRLTREHTPDSVPFRRFPTFSLWWASAHLHRRKPKITENCLLTGASQF